MARYVLRRKAFSIIQDTLYNADQNILYWGNLGYQNCLDYTKMDGELQAHKEEILKQYTELAILIRDDFHQ